MKVLRLRRKAVLRAFAVLCAVCSLLCGCSVTAGIDKLLSPPKLSADQEEIYAALLKFTGSKITLRYPKSGSCLSAFVVENIDNEPTDEAIVFYERSGAASSEDAIRINVLDKIDGEWCSIYDMAGTGTDIEKVMLTKLGDSGVTSVIVGFGLISEGGKAVKVYNYENNILTPAYTDSYSLMDVVDADGNGTSELIIASVDSSTAAAVARLIEVDENGTFLISTYPLSANTSDYSQLLFNDIYDGTPGIYIDTINSNGQLQTEVLCFRNDVLGSAFESTGYVEMTARSTGYATMDIDGDGKLEIPVISAFPGYENYFDSEKLPLTLWTRFENGSLVTEYMSYYSISDGYAFMFPDSWKGNVTAKLKGREIVFYEYSSSSELSVDSSLNEIISIAAASGDDSADVLQNSGYTVICESGSTSCLIKYPANPQSTLSPTTTELRACFVII